MDAYSALLLIHIPVGAASLLAGLSAMVLRKRVRLHRRAGRIYFWGMTVVCVTALLLAIVHPSLFFVTISIFSYQGAFLGYRSAKRRQKRPAWHEWVATVITAATGAYMVSTLETILMVFGGLAIYTSATDIRRFTQERWAKEYWLPAHIGKMLASYIAASTAFIVNVWPWGPNLVAWLAPTAVGVPLLIYWQRAYRKKPKPKKEPELAARK